MPRDWFVVAFFHGFEKKVHGACPEPADAMQKHVCWLATALLALFSQLPPKNAFFWG
jgi:hypothetical protein